MGGTAKRTASIAKRTAAKEINSAPDDVDQQLPKDRG
jgi:hypothetical protein